MIEICDLCKTFGSGASAVTALNDINLTVNDGEIFGIIGLSGAGKSTLVRCMNLLEKPTSGTVLLDGKDLTKLRERELLQVRRSIGMIFQSFNLFEQRTVAANVRYPLEIAGASKQEATDKVKKLLRLVGLEDRSRFYPSQLSGGQKQRVAIARALATDPKVLLCDEATSALDPDTTRSILHLLKEINSTMGVTIIVITHEMKVIDEICDRVAVIDKSRIAELGRVSEVFANPKSDIAKGLVMPQGALAQRISGKNSLRIIFDGESSYRPALAEMILACQAPVNIMFADTKDIEGCAYGQILVQLPEDEHVAGKMIAWLQASGLRFSQEVS